MVAGVGTVFGGPVLVGFTIYRFYNIFTTLIQSEILFS